MTHEKIEIRYKNNLEYIKNLDISLFNNIINADISHLEINLTEEGINISSQEKYIYPQNVNASISTQINNYIKNPTSIFKAPFTYTSEENLRIQSPFIKSLEKISHYDNQTFTHYKDNKEIDFYPILIINTIGTGQHIEQLLQKVQTKHLIILDQDYSFLKLSMHIIDWKRLLSSLLDKGIKVDFYINTKADRLAETFLNYIYSISPYKVYYVNYFIHLNSEFSNIFFQTISKKVPLLFNGWGFIDDELLSLKRTLRNLEDNIPVYMGTNKQLPPNATLFIVASGPSIDNDIKYIKQHKDNAIIFSCGTALRILEQNDIVPDFHFEIERGDGTHHVLEEYTSKEFRDKVALIGLNVLNNMTFTEDFQEQYMYFRASDSGSSIVPDNIPKLFYTNPTVTNAAITFASEFIWDKVYLFGADMGFKDEKNHHSKDTFHYTKGDKKYNWDDHGNAEITNTVDANFGDHKISTTKIFNWSKQNLENKLINNKFQTFNCSDGSKIEYTIPFHSKDIKITNHSKKDTIKAIKSNFKDLQTNTAKFKEKYDSEVLKYHQLINKITTILKKINLKNFNDIFSTIDQIFSLFDNTQINLNHPVNRSNTGEVLLRGTMVTAFSLIYTHSMATNDIKKVTQFANASFKLLIQFLETLKMEIPLKV